MMATHICPRMFTDRLLRKISGATIRITANTSQTPIAGQPRRRGRATASAFNCSDIVQPSRVPSRPRGLKIRISTRNRYGRIGATCEMVRFIRVLLSIALPSDTPIDWNMPLSE